MGADAFVAFYGIKIPLDPDDEVEFERCALEQDPRRVAAKQAGLEAFQGRMTDGEDYFLYIGRSLANIGLQFDQYAKYSLKNFVEIAADVDRRLQQARFLKEAKLHLQFVGQY